jgi:hypothetical protein
VKEPPYALGGLTFFLGFFCCDHDRKKSLTGNLGRGFSAKRSNVVPPSIVVLCGLGSLPLASDPASQTNPLPGTLAGESQRQLSAPLGLRPPFSPQRQPQGRPMVSCLPPASGGQWGLGPVRQTCTQPRGGHGNVDQELTSRQACQRGETAPRPCSFTGETCVRREPGSSGLAQRLMVH